MKRNVLERVLEACVRASVFSTSYRYSIDTQCLKRNRPKWNE